MAFWEGFLNSFSTQSQWGEYVLTTLWWVGIVFWILLGIAAVGFAFYFFSYNIPTHVYEIIGQEKILRFLRKTRARVKSKEGVTQLKIFGVPEAFTPPRATDYQLGRKGKLLNLIKEGTDFRPFIMTANPGHITIQDIDVRFWGTQSRKIQAKKYIEPSFFQKYGHYMAFVFGLLVLGWMYYIMITTVGGQLDKQLQIGDKLAEIWGSKLTGP